MLGAIMSVTTFLDMPDDFTVKQVIKGLLWSEGMLMIYGNALFLYLRRGIDGQTDKMAAAAEEITDERARQLLTKVLADLKQEKEVK
jgi:hypothetical protein